MISKPRTLLMVSAAALFAAACAGAKGKAEAAIAAADQAITAIGPDAEKIVPLDLQRLTSAVTAARDTLAKGDATAAMSAVADIPAKAQELAGSLAGKKAQLTAELDTLGFAMTKNVAAVQAKIDEFTKTKKLPKGLDAAKLATIKETAAAAKTEWAGIQADIASGNLASAFGKGTALRLKVSDAMVALGLSADDPAWHNLTIQPKQ